MSRSLTGAGWFFCASHRDARGLHGHSYEVMAFWPEDQRLDAVGLQGRLKGVLAGLDHQTLPDELARAEDIARFIGRQLPECVRVDISRPIERFSVKVWL